MPEIGEPVDPGMIDEDETQCPFDHEVKPPTVQNDLIGVGTKLANKMKNATGTFMYEPYKEKVEAIPNPKDVAKHPFNKSSQSKGRPVRISGNNGDGTEWEHTYPVTCAAHHCIPAQESLKESPLLAFMCKKGDSEAIKGGSYSDGVVWADVGYDVNGSQNGIFLPGSYAVGGGRGGMGVWTGNADGDEDAPEDAVDEVTDPNSNLLTGALNDISITNRKWLYVSQAVTLCPGQFHDRHVDYSTFVQSVLEKVFENYVNLHQTKIVESKCSECKKQADKMEKLGIPTPFGLAGRLNKVSAKFQTYLNGTTWRMNIFTSKWGQAYMVAVKAKTVT